MGALDKIKSFFRRTKAKTKVEEPGPTTEVAKKEAPQTPEKKS